MVQRAQRQGSSLSSSSPHHCQVRPQSEITIHGAFKGACQESRVTLSRPHVAQVKRLSGSGLQHSLRTQIIISSTLHHLSKSDFRHHLIQPVLISLPLRDFGFSSPVNDSLSSSRFALAFDQKKVDFDACSTPFWTF